MAVVIRMAAELVTPIEQLVNVVRVEDSAGRSGRAHQAERRVVSATHAELFENCAAGMQRRTWKIIERERYDRLARMDRDRTSEEVARRMPLTLAVQGGPERR